MMLVEAKNLSLARRLQPTDLNLRAGELACLVGPNGSGKTSLLHALAGIGTPGGEVRIGSEDPKGMHPNRRQRLLSFLPASRDIKWPLTARGLISLGLPGGAGESVEAVTANLEVAELLDRRVDLLSTGERSRILIARALAALPKLLLLDEPIANLDPLWQLKLMDCLLRLVRSESQSILLAVHDLEVARRYADRLIVMDGGRIEADGEPADLLGSPVISRIFGIEHVEGRWRPAA